MCSIQFFGIVIVLYLILKNTVSVFQNHHTQDEKLSASFGSCNLEIDEPCSSGKVSFNLFLNMASEAPVTMTAVNKTLSLLYNSTRDTKVLVHGFSGHVDSKDSAILRTVYLQQDKFNLIVVDWSDLVKIPCYPTAVFSTWQAGKCLAMFLENYVKDGDFRRVHVIGFSLGAHVAAFAGLDPALPFFASLEDAMKLDKEDGNFVDIIHTNVGIFGKIEPTGHVDFYLNGGFFQPACQLVFNVPLCSHLMATVYYAESVMEKNKGFWGVPCQSHFQYLIGRCGEFKKEDRVLMGEKCDSRSRGIYFVKTKSEPPYALG